jgi:hypothetical protein
MPIFMRRVREARALAISSGSGRDRSLRQEVQFRDPDDVETPTLSRVHLGEGLRECFCIRDSCVARKLVKDTELE